jgi:hypothetical protein
MIQHKTRNIALGLLAGGVALWGLNEAFDDNTSVATSRPGHGGVHGMFFGRGLSHVGSSVGNALGIGRGGFGATGGGHGSGS